MWLEIICGLIIYQLYRFFFYGSNNALDVENSDFNAIFSVANRLEKLCGGKAYVGLNIPDADTGTRKSIDIVLVSKGEAAVISVKNVSGFVSINEDGTWTCEGGRRHRKEHLPDPVAEVKKRASVLESYLEQRGVALPEGYFSYKVIIPNPNFRLELKGSKYILGEFLEFKGKEEDTHALRHIKRSKVGHIATQKTSMLGLAHSKLQVVYYPRDYRSEGSSSSDWREVEVRSSTEVVFHPSNSNKVRKYKLSSIMSMSLSA